MIDNLIIKPRQSGKTTELIKESNKHWTYIICANEKRKQYIVDVANRLGVDIPNPITANEVLASKGLQSPWIKEVLVDDLGDVLSALINKHVAVATHTGKVDIGLDVYKGF